LYKFDLRDARGVEKEFKYFTKFDDSDEPLDSRLFLLPLVQAYKHPVSIDLFADGSYSLPQFIPEIPEEVSESEQAEFVKRARQLRAGRIEA
jgi:hypothetical protein